MKKSLFKYCKSNLHSVGNGRLKRCASLETLHQEYGFGRLDDLFCHFDERDKINLIERVQLDIGVHLFRESYPEKKSRLVNAIENRNEKQGALNISEDFVLVNSLDSLCLNNQQHKTSEISSLGQFLSAPEIETIEHKQIVLVENLIVMANLRRLNIPESLKEALWLYRGDIQANKQTGSAYRFFRRFKATNKLICFADLDPSGLQICLTSGATHWLTLSDEKQLNTALKGAENEWFNQTKIISYLNKYEHLPRYCSQLFTQMKEKQITLKQEHILQHSLQLSIFPLND